MYVCVPVGGRLFFSWGCMCHCEGLLVLPATLMTAKNLPASL